MGRNDRSAAYNQQTQRQTAFQNAAQKNIEAIPGDLTPEQKSAATQATMGGIDIGAQNTRDELFRRASATGSSAAIPETIAETNRAAARDKAAAGSNLILQEADIPVQRAMEKAGLYMPLAGQSTQAMASVAPQPQPSTFDRILQGVTGAAKIGMAPFTGGLTLA